MIVFLPETPTDMYAGKLGTIVGACKSMVSNQWLKICKVNDTTMGKLWQERYYDHIIRNDHDLSDDRYYIDTNPDRWVIKYESE